MNATRRMTIVVIACLLFGALAPTAVSAQPAANNSTDATNTTAPSGTSPSGFGPARGVGGVGQYNGSENATAPFGGANNSSSGGWLGSVLNPVQFVSGAVGAVGGMLQSDIRQLVQWFNGVYLSSVAPGEISRGDLTPEITGVFADMQDLRYQWFAPLSFALWIYMLVRALYGGPERLHQEASTLVSVLVVIMVWDQMYPLLYHAADAFALGFAPSAEELTGSFAGLSKLGLSVIVISGILAWNVGLLAVGILEILIRDAVMIYAAACLPFLFTLWKTRIPYLSTLGQLSVGTWMLLLVLQPAMSVVLRLGFIIDWGSWGSALGLPGAVLSPIMSLVALTIATVGIPFLCLAALYFGNPHKRVSDMGKKTSRKFRDEAKTRGPNPRDVATGARDTVSTRRPTPIQNIRSRRSSTQQISYDDSHSTFDARSEGRKSTTIGVKSDKPSRRTTSFGGSDDTVDSTLQTPTYKMRGRSSGTSSKRSQNIGESLDD